MRQAIRSLLKAREFTLVAVAIIAIGIGANTAVFSIVDAALLLMAFAIVALVMAAAGLYGVISYTVAQRTQEIGVRVALGAEPRSVVRMVAVEGLGLTAIGMAIGTIAAMIVSRAMRAVLFGVSAADPVTYAGTLLLFAATACAAFIVPARRAAGIDPLTALRSE